MWLISKGGFSPLALGCKIQASGEQLYYNSFESVGVEVISDIYKEKPHWAIEGGKKDKSCTVWILVA